MRKSLRLSAAIGAGAAVAFFSMALALSGTFSSNPSKAYANSTVNINDGNVPTTAAEYQDKECAENLGGGPYPGLDVWVFVLPGPYSESGDFVSITADFDGHPSVTITAADDPDNFLNGGPQTSKGWIITPEGWELTGATAEITGEAEFFNLTHTCPASGPSASPSPSMSPSMSPSPSPSMSPSMSPSASPSSSQSPSMSPSAQPSVSPSMPPTSPSPSVRPSHSQRPYVPGY